MEVRDDLLYSPELLNCESEIRSVWCRRFHSGAAVREDLSKKTTLGITITAVISYSVLFKKGLKLYCCNGANSLGSSTLSSK